MPKTKANNMVLPIVGLDIGTTSSGRFYCAAVRALTNKAQL